MKFGYNFQAAKIAATICDLPHVEWMESVYVLARVQHLDHTLLAQTTGQGQLRVFGQ